MPTPFAGFAAMRAGLTHDTHIEACKIVKDKQHQSVKFADGKSAKVDHYTASALTQVHNALNDSNKKKFATMVSKSKDHFGRASDFAFRQMK